MPTPVGNCAGFSCIFPRMSVEDTPRNTDNSLIHGRLDGLVHFVYK